MDDCVRTKLAENENTVRDKKSEEMNFIGRKTWQFYGEMTKWKCFKLALVSVEKKWTGTHTPSFLQNM